jgi:hypothetical protein
MPSFVILTELQQMFFFISVHSLVLTMISGTGSDFWNFAESRFGAVDLQGSPFLWTITFFFAFPASELWWSSSMLRFWDGRVSTTVNSSLDSSSVSCSLESDSGSWVFVSVLIFRSPWEAGDLSLPGDSSCS